MAPVVDAQGRARVPLDQAKALASFPKTPGMQLHVNPGACTYSIVDPLHGNTKMLNEIATHFREAGDFSQSGKMDGVERVDGKLDQHRMKSLCRELLCIVQAGDGVLLEGKLEAADIEDLPGRFLLNPGSTVPNTQPIYEDDFPAWVDNLSRSGG
jgi:hypothetical protein